MSELDDLYDEMRRLGKASEKGVNGSLSGDLVDDAVVEDMASALQEAREHLTQAPDASIRRSHLLAMAAAIDDVASEASQDAASPAHNRPTFGRRFMRRTWVIGTRAAVAVGALALSSLGLAYAGVDLPGTAAEQAWQAVGVHLPNQVELPEQSKAGDVRDVIESSEEKGCEFGQAVSEAASADSQKQGPSEDPCSNGGAPQAKGSSATGEENSADGRANAAEKSDGHSDAGADNAGSNDDQGRGTASEKSGGKSDAGSDNAGGATNGGTTGGRDNAGDNDDLGGETASGGSDNSGAGKGKASEESGGASDSHPGP
jgi:hypothetical protein